MLHALPAYLPLLEYFLKVRLHLRGNWYSDDAHDLFHLVHCKRKLATVHKVCVQSQKKVYNQDFFPNFLLEARTVSIRDCIVSPMSLTLLVKYETSF